MNIAAYGITMEKVKGIRNRTDAEPAIKHKRLSKVDMRQKLIGNNLMLIGKIGVMLRLIKTASVGMCVLDLRKVLILPPYPGCRENNSPFVPVFPLYFLQTYDFTLKVF